ncbi:MAG TPA: tRNA preQ1(34) S-adenosylmethionine ribosyltransferase-isomerase QueA [Pyrinomonadaceae bacterium]|nr:tRNA preQ1(34) S-adenosylmethionine ribosyltransferase-isomerase QueA [Pyrinomonadaceae bacterium]
MQLSDFDYELPEHLIAQEASLEREGSRMLAVDRSTGSLRDDSFVAIVEHLRAGDVVVLNNTKVFPARLFGKTETGAAVEIFLVNKMSDSSWEALARPARRLKKGKLVDFGPDLSGLIARDPAEGRVMIDFDFDGDFEEILGRVGRTPLPPYIKRHSGGIDDDRARYQTVYAKSSGAIAAPTAGLHFTAGVLERIQAKGVEIAEITLHVGYGTFEPVRAEDLSRHSVLPERYEIEESAAGILNSARAAGRRIIAVGTTTTRALETSFARNGKFVAGAALADLTITPGYKFLAVNALLTNFHLPQSSLLILVSTFGGHELIMDAYRHAVEEGYRFYSYGDCMFIE